MRSSSASVRPHLESLEDRTVPSPVVHAIFPSQTDPAIDQGIGRHFTYRDPDVPAAGKLFIFLPGTGAPPGPYQLILDTAAALGYHAVGLTYVNDRAVAELCTFWHPTCHKDVRLEIIDGTDRTPLVDVNRANSIENRLLRLLQYLERTYPTEGWGQFLSGEQFRWDQMMFAGHSQGGGHAAMLGKLHSLYRVGLFSATEMAPWTLETLSDTPTPPERYYGFAHLLEPQFFYFYISWVLLGVPGEPTFVEFSDPSYGGSRQLLTYADVPPERYHGAVVVDAYTPRGTGGTPLFRDVWTYMIDPRGGGGPGSGPTGGWDSAAVAALTFGDSTSPRSGAASARR